MAEHSCYDLSDHYGYLTYFSMLFQYCKLLLSCFFVTLFCLNLLNSFLSLYVSLVYAIYLLKNNMEYFSNDFDRY